MLASFSSHSDVHDFCIITETVVLTTDIASSYVDVTSPASIAFWSPAIKKEEDAIRAIRTFQLVERNSDMHEISSSYVCRVKTDVGPKVRIVSKRFRQTLGVEYHSTYYAVVSFAVL